MGNRKKDKNDKTGKKLENEEQKQLPNYSGIKFYLLSMIHLQFFAYKFQNKCCMLDFELEA